MTPRYQYNNKEYKNRRRELRNDMPKAEIILWDQLKGKNLEGYKFRRQYGIGPFVVDFFCSSKRLAIEIDGDSHFEEGAEKYDKRREDYIKKNNISFLRFTNIDIYDNLDGVIRTISEKLMGEQLSFHAYIYHPVTKGDTPPILGGD